MGKRAISAYGAQSNLFFEAVLHILYLPQTAPLGCTIAILAAAQAPRHSMSKLAPTQGKADRQAALLSTCQAVMLYQRLHSVRRVLKICSWQPDVNLPCGITTPAIRCCSPPTPNAPLCAPGGRRLRSEHHVMWRGIDTPSLISRCGKWLY
jgi:hypothetical protein